MGKVDRGPRPLGLMGSLLALVLSAALGVGFVMVVNKAHELFAGAALDQGIPHIAVLR